jgi:chromosome segregation ATPase
MFFKVYHTTSREAANMSADLQLSIVLGAALAGSFSNVFNNAGLSVNKLQEKLSSLGKNQDAIQKFGRLQSTMTQTADKLNAARGRVRELGEQMRAASNPSEQLKRQFTAAHQEASKLQAKLGDERKELGQLRNSLNAAGVDTKNFSDEQTRLAQKTKLAAQAEKARQAQERLATAQGNYDATKQNLSNAKGDIVASAGILLALKAPIDAAANFEQAMAKVSAVSGATGSDFERLTEQARLPVIPAFFCNL